MFILKVSELLKKEGGVRPFGLLNKKVVPPTLLIIQDERLLSCFVVWLVTTQHLVPTRHEVRPGAALYLSGNCKVRPLGPDIVATRLTGY
jgi:hypothetical protein